MATYQLELPPGFDVEGGSGQEPPAIPVGFEIEAPTEGKRLAEKIAKVGVGAVSRVAGLPGDVAQLIDLAGRYTAKKGYELATGRDAPLAEPMPEFGSRVIEKGISKVIPTAEAESKLGRIAQEAGTEAIAGLIAPQRLFGAAVSGLTGAAVKTAEEGGAGTGVQVGTAVGVPLAAGVVQGLLSRRVPAKLLSQATTSVTDEQFAAAQKLMDDAASIGSPITAAEALSDVAPELALLQRAVEETREGSKYFNSIIRDRASNVKRVEDALREGLGRTPTPSEVSAAINEESRKIIEAAKKARAEIVEPLYDKAKYDLSGMPRKAPDSVSRETVKLIDELISSAPEDVRLKKIRNLFYEKTPSGSIRMTADKKPSFKKNVDQLHEVKTMIDDIMMASNPTTQMKGMMIKNKYLGLLDEAIPEYKAAREEYAKLSRDLVDPLENGDIGRLAAAKDYKAIRRNFFDPETARPEDVRYIGNLLKDKDPEIMRKVVQVELENQMNKALTELQSGVSEYAGAKFRKNIIGNPQQQKNLEEMFNFIPDGKKAYAGYKKFLDILAAQGRRLPSGSPTAVKQQLQRELIGAIPDVTRPGITGKIPILKDIILDRAYKTNADKLASILTSPDGVAKIRELTKLNPKSRKASIIVSEILGLTLGENNDAM